MIGTENHVISLELPYGAYEITQLNQEIYKQLSNNHILNAIYSESPIQDIS